MESQNQQKEFKQVMDIRQLSEYLGIGKSKIYSLIRQKKIPASRIGRQYRFSKEVIDAWLKEKIITKKEEPSLPFFNREKNKEPVGGGQSGNNNNNINNNNNNNNNNNP
ncbi:MAG: helix-turn-helix domain-containing protein [Endomicrobiales bacterium]